MAADEVKRDIEQALDRNAWTDAHNIEVDDRKVTLRCTVTSYTEKEAAEEAAWAEPGVTEVDNRIYVA